MLELGSDGDCGIFSAVEALTAITTSAAPLENKLHSVCLTMLDDVQMVGAWILNTTAGVTNVLACEFDDDALKALSRHKESPAYTELLKAMTQQTMKTHLSHSPLIERDFFAAGVKYVSACFPLVAHGRAIGSLVCFFDKKDVRSDIYFNRLRVCARILAMAISSSSEWSLTEREAQWKRRFDALAVDLPGAAALLSLRGDVIDVFPGDDPLLGKSEAVLVVGHDSITSAGFEHARRQVESFQSAVHGATARCHVYGKDIGSSRIIEKRFTPVIDQRGVTTEVMLFARDVTDVAKLKQSVKDFTQRDSVTGAMTMGALITKARSHLAAEGAPGKQTVFMSIEVDASGSSVHLLGNEAFEELIQAINARISKCFPGVDSLARRGDRNFVAMVDVMEGKKFANDIALKIINLFRESLLARRKDHSMSVTIGYSIYPDDGKVADDLFRYADIAAVNAQRSGRNCALPFRREMAQDADDRSRLESRLYRAAENEEFVLAFQPKVNTRDGSISGAEALLRWTGKNAIGPARFIPVAEECGLISFIGEWALRQACMTAKRWADQGLRIPISVNVSTRQFHDNDFHNIVAEILNETQCDPALIDLEVTEGVMFVDPSAAMASFGLLKEMGVGISIDDFGMGFSSLSYLKCLPADAIKIDRTFVDGLPGDANNRAIVMAIISMAKAMSMRVIAEGAEDVESVDYLRSLGCDDIQGYFYSKPLFETEFLAWIRARDPVVKVA